MQLNFPYLFIAVFVSLALFYYLNEKNRLKKERRRERLQQKHEAYLNALLENADLAHKTDVQEILPQNNND